jgi:hypothetical protein
MREKNAQNSSSRNPRVTQEQLLMDRKKSFHGHFRPKMTSATSMQYIVKKCAK